MIFDPKIIEDHATKPGRGLGRKVADVFAVAGEGVDAFTRGPGKRQARSVCSAPSRKKREVPKAGGKRPCWWQLAPDGTIERMYDVGAEPIVLSPKGD